MGKLTLNGQEIAKEGQTESAKIDLGVNGYVVYSIKSHEVGGPAEVEYTLLVGGEEFQKGSFTIEPDSRQIEKSIIFGHERA